MTKALRLRFDGSILESCERILAAEGPAWGQTHFGSNRNGFYGFENGKPGTLADLKKVIHSPWKRGLERVATMKGKISKADLPAPKSIRRKRKRSQDFGDDIDADMMYSDIQSKWWSQVGRDIRSGFPRLTLLVDIGGNADVSSDAMFWRPTAAMVIADALENAGYRVRIFACSYSRGFARTNNGRSRDLATRLQVKPFDKPVNPSIMINAMAPWFFRTMVFRSFYAAIAASKVKLTIDSSLGTHIPTRKNKGDFIEEGEPSFILDSQWDETSTVEAIQDCLG